ncbi:MAG: CCA tRNA nucleotidyltransferase [Planctomycetes bacterium]|nr:CCA tRNA nucleotidyltransferase [Planctomycetota bacterium]
MQAERVAVSLLKRLRERGHQAFFAGGCVRDLLLGVPPKDYDIATSARPEEVQALFPRSVPVGAQFGVVRVQVARLEFELATFRRDGPYLDGRRPAHVDLLRSAEEDARRRDFTVNGMFYDPVTARVVDFVGGREDLTRRVIRAIGEPAARFEEDRLRLLRMVRLACQLGFSIDPATAASARALAPRVLSVSAERVRDELLRMLTGPRPAGALEGLDAHDLLLHVLPEVCRMKGVEQPPEFHPEGDVWVHTLLVLRNLPARPTGTLALAALLHDVGKPGTFRRAEDRIRFDGHAELGETMSREVCERLKLSGEETARVGALVGHHMRFLAIREMRTATLKRLLREPWSEELLELHRADALGALAGTGTYEYCREKLAEFRAAEAAASLRPPRLVTGQDLLALGYAPGPIFREILQAVEDAQLEGELTEREAALRWLEARFPRQH